MADEMITINRKELERLQFIYKEYESAKQQATEVILTEQLYIKNLRDEIDKLKGELLGVKTMIDEITKARVKHRNKNETDLMEKFFRDYIVAENGSKVKTVEVMKKLNEVVADKNIRYNQFEVAKFIKDKGISKKKTGGHDYYLNVRFSKI